MTFVAGTVKRTGVTNINTTIDATISGDGTNPIDGNDIVGGLSTKTVAFAANDTADKTVSWEVVGDSAVEPDEGFKIVLSNPSSPGGTISVPVGRGTIMNDDNSAPAAIFSGTTADTNNTDGTLRSVGSVRKYKMAGTLADTAFEFWIGGTDSDGMPGFITVRMAGDRTAGYTMDASGTRSLDNNWNYLQDGGHSPSASFEMIVDRDAATLSLKIGDSMTPVVKSIGAGNNGPFFRFKTGAAAQPITVTAVS